MKETRLVQIVGELIGQVDKLAYARWEVVIRRKEIRLVPLCLRHVLDKTVMPLSRFDLENGLSSKQWEGIREVLFLMNREGLII